MNPVLKMKAANRKPMGRPKRTLADEGKSGQVWLNANQKKFQLDKIEKITTRTISFSSS